MRLLFKTQIMSGWHEPDPYWLREVQTRARFLWVRLLGLTEHHHTKDAPSTVQWERAARRLCPRRGTCAFLMVRFPSNGRPTSPGMTMGIEARGRWPETMLVAERLRVLLLGLAAKQPHPIGVFAEDFSARWLAASLFEPEIVVLDNPMLGVWEDWPLYRRPGYVRASYWPALGQYDFWKLPFAQEDLLAEHVGVQTARRHGLWGRVDRGEVDRCLSGRLIRPIAEDPSPPGEALGPA